VCVRTVLLYATLFCLGFFGVLILFALRAPRPVVQPVDEPLPSDRPGPAAAPVVGYGYAAARPTRDELVAAFGQPV
jgi:hypothetical protein